MRGRMTLRVLVDDNFHFTDEDERYQAGTFAVYEEAVAKCREIVDKCLLESLQPGMTADDLLTAYKTFGEDPWIAGTPDGTARFSAWDYARERCEEICPRTGPEAKP
jgi:hypothetical protein